MAKIIKGGLKKKAPARVGKGISAVREDATGSFAPVRRATTIKTPFFSKTETETPQETPEEVGAKTAAKTAAGIRTRKGLESIGEKIGSVNLQSIIAAKNIPNMIERVKELSDEVPDETWKAWLLTQKEEHTPFISPERQKLASNMILMNQSIIRLFQGARPTDKDYEILKRAIDSSSKGKEAFMAAIEEVEQMFKRKRKDLIGILSLGYDVDQQTLEKMAGTEKMQVGGAIEKTATKKTIKLPSGRTLTIGE